jgi:ribosomal protein S18 acetylase RimI-like enzyme
MPAPVLIRPVTPADLPAVGRLAEGLVEYHRALDPRRYMKIERAAEGYARFLGAELADKNAVVLCAARETDGLIVGYAYGTKEGKDWNALLDPHGALHDVFVDASARRQGIAERLILELCARLEALGAPRVLLHTAVQNREGQALFAKLGFRSTMIELTREAGGSPP